MKNILAVLLVAIAASAFGDSTDKPPIIVASDVGRCIADCDMEQGMCIGQCEGDGQCIANCNAAHGRCVARCMRQ